MGKKLTIGFIRSEFVKEGYKLLTEIYENSDQKLDYICPKNHKHNITWSNWKQGKRCPYCAGNGKLSIEFIKSEFAKEGYKLLTKIYKNNAQKLDYICSNGHKHFITWHDWRVGKKCPCCAKCPPLNIEFIRKEFKKEGYILLTEVYENNLQKLDYICPNGHKHSVVWSNWKQGKRCPYCAGNGKLSIEFIKSEFAKEGYELLTEVYEGSNQKLDYICFRGHKHSISWNNWREGKRCGVCKIFGGSGSQSGFWKGGISKEPYCQNWTKKLKESIKKRDGYKCINPYCTSKNPNDLTIHHIDYNKKNCDPNNLITVCKSCNGRANIDREFHKAWYHAITHRRYGYIYD